VQWLVDQLTGYVKLRRDVARRRLQVQLLLETCQLEDRDGLEQRLQALHVVRDMLGDIITEVLSELARESMDILL
jgi:hypothetical protein